MKHFRLKETSGIRRHAMVGTSAAEFAVVTDGLKPIIGCHLFLLFCTCSYATSTYKSNRVSNFASHFAIKEKVATGFFKPITRIGISINHVVKSKFHEHFHPRQQKEDAFQSTNEIK